MKYIFFLYILFCNKLCFGQSNNWEISTGLGISGVNQLLTNNTKFENHIKFNKKINSLDNKFKNNILQSGYFRLSKLPSNGIFRAFKFDISFAIYSFGSVYYKEDKLSVTFGKNDTINSPNWLVSKYSLSYAEFGISKEINIIRHFRIELGLYCSYMIELYGTSRLMLWDSAYSQIDQNIFYFNKEFPNQEFNQINYGFRSEILIFPEKRLHPVFLFTQCLKDISKKNININQHANIWSFNVGLKYNFRKRKQYF